MFGSMDPADDPNIPPETLELWLTPDEEWARLETSFNVTRVFNPRDRFRPYLLADVGIERIHPRSELFYNKPPEGLEPGESPTYATNGIRFTIQPGFELALGRTLSLDVAGFYTYYNTGSYDMSPLGLPDVDSGIEWGGRVGLAWQPFSATPRDPSRKAILVDPGTGQPLPLPPADSSRDAWGVPRSWGWATAEMLAINFGASMFNEYVRDANFNQISPRSFWANLEEGFTWDDNEFKTNQLIHPFNGATYFNAARANGIGFWGSSVMSIAGAFVWECCGETHPCRSTTWSRPASGHRPRRGDAPHLLADPRQHEARKGRVAREAAALFEPHPRVQPPRHRRLERGQGQPRRPLEWRPDFQLDVRAGGRVIGQGESITENTNSYGFLESGISYGDPWNRSTGSPTTASTP